MLLIYNHQCRFFSTAKTHKFLSLNNIKVENLKLRLTIDLRGIYSCNTSNILVSHLRPLLLNQCTISDQIS